MHHPVSLIAGASGLVGSHIVRELMHNNQACVLIVRKKISEFNDNTLQLISDFSQLSADLPKRLPPIDHVYLCLGLRLKTQELMMMSSERKKEFYKVDFDLSLELANIAFENGAKKISIISAVGADINSLNYYAKIKGKLEKSICKIGYEQVIIAQPGHLLGVRNDPRGPEIPFLEAGLEVIKPILQGPLKKFRQISSEKVAKSLVHEMNLKDNQYSPKFLDYEDFK